MNTRNSSRITAMRKVCGVTKRRPNPRDHTPKGSSAAAARISSGCSHVQSNTSGAMSAVNAPPSTPPADMTR